MLENACVHATGSVHSSSPSLAVAAQLNAMAEAAKGAADGADASTKELNKKVVKSRRRSRDLGARAHLFLKVVP